MKILYQSDSNVVKLSGDVDLECWARVRDTLLSVLRREHSVVIDVAHVEYMDSQGFGAILATAREARTLGLPYSAVVVRHPVRNVTRLMQITGFDRIVAIEHAPCPRPGGRHDYSQPELE